MSVTEVLLREGGVATRARLMAQSSRAEVDRALRSGEIVVLAHGRYALPAVDEALREAHRLAGVASHHSAALHWGWPVKTPPPLPDVTVPRSRKLTREQRRGVSIHRASLSTDDVSEGFTSRDRTVLDCLRNYPFDEGLAVADSALREGFSPTRLRALARDARGPGAKQVRAVAAAARGEAANPFESVLRAIALEVPGLRVRPQVPLYGRTEFLGQPDLVDEELRMLLEADSFEWHGGRTSLRRDARRYDLFVVHGWWVLRFAWEDVMFDPEWVRMILLMAVDERTNGTCSRRAAA